MHLILLPCFLAFAVMVLLAGLFMKSYAVKEGLGKLSRYAASTAIFLGIFIFIAAIVMHIMMLVWHKNKGWCEGEMCHNNTYGKHNTEYKKGICTCDHGDKHGMGTKKNKCLCDHCE